jgi:hypothetical protein
MTNLLKHIDRIHTIFKVLLLVTISSLLHTLKGVIYVESGIDWRFVLIEVVYIFILFLIIRVVSLHGSKCYTIKKN